jgi:Golgi phosphoprotein 3 (GPP34)
METLGDDLVLLSILPNGVIGTAAKLRFGLSGAELIRLAAQRRVGIERGRIIMLDEAPTGDALLDEALMSMDDGLTAKKWVARQRGDVTRRYLDGLVSAGMIRTERRKALGFIPVTGWKVLDAERLAAARARLDAIAHGSGGVDSEQAALAGLASAIGLPSLVYPGYAGRAARKRVAAAGSSVAPAAHVTKTAADTAQAAVRASIDAATEAAVSAATEAAHHSASHGGHTGGGGGHH